MAKMLITESEFDALLAEVKPGAPPLPFSFGPTGTFLDTEHDGAAWAVKHVEMLRAAEADRLEKTVRDAIDGEIYADQTDRAAGDNAPSGEVAQAATTAVFQALKDAGYRITRKD